MNRPSSNHTAIRRIRAADNAVLAAVLSTVRKEHDVAAHLDDYLEPEEHDLHGVHQAPGAAYFVAEHAGRVVGGAGFGSLRRGPADTCELQRMYLLRSCRGLGLGARLLDRCLDAARDAGYRYCYAETMDFMRPAGRLYRSRGFELLNGPLGDTGHAFPTAWYRVAL